MERIGVVGSTLPALPTSPTPVAPMRTNLGAPRQSPGLLGQCEKQIVRDHLWKRRTPVTKLILAAMIAAFSAAVVLPAAFGTDSAYAKTTKKKETKKKPTSKMPEKSQ
jgi:hypothetical protein